MIEDYSGPAWLGGDWRYITLGRYCTSPGLSKRAPTASDEQPCPVQHPSPAQVPLAEAAVVDRSRVRPLTTDR
ncbi:unnamed protein product [Leptidea sinapis]|uniref:Uncharacterized protein n=1 Tax=Leptidea sinapis TaxID=189913 RepID=A0A5E4PS39_9NEOP|nr:unnamed protein product [Leptidea sinapis]